MQKRVFYIFFLVHLLSLAQVLCLNSSSYLENNFIKALNELSNSDDNKAITVTYVGQAPINWNTNKPLPKLIDCQNVLRGPFFSNKQLLYCLAKESNGDTAVVHYKQVAQFFEIENHFLKNADALKHYNIDEIGSEKAVTIKTPTKLLYAHYSGQWPYWVYLISLLCCVFSLFIRLKKKTSFLALGLVIVFVLISFFIPLNSFSLAQPSLYAQSSFIPNLYQLIVLLALYFCGLAFLKRLPLPNSGLLIALSVHGLILSLVVKSIIHNSKIGLDVLNASNNLVLTACLLGIIASFGLSFFIFIRRFKFNEQINVGFALSLIALMQVIGYLMHFHDVLVVGWGSLIGLLLYLTQKLRFNHNQIQLTLFIWLMFSVSFIYLHYDLKRTANNENYLAQQIAEETNPFISFSVERLEKNQAAIIANNKIQDTLSFLENNLFGNKYAEHYVSKTKEDITPLYTFNFSEHTYFVYPKNYNYYKGFPELLKTEKWYNHVSSRIYFARYYENKLLQTNNLDIFPISLKQFNPSAIPSIKKVSNENTNYTALVHVSHTPLEYSISIIILIACFLGVLFITWQYDLIRSSLNLKRKIQLSIFGIAIITIGLSSALAIVQLKESNRENNRSILKEKAQSVRIELEHKLNSESGEQYLNNNLALTALLNKFSNVFFTDISIYQNNGRLLATSQKDLYNDVFLGSQIDQEFLAHCSKNEAVSIVTENIGKLSYASAYMPLDFHGKKYIVNLPFFARESILNQQLQNFIINIINALIIAALISIILAALLSRQIINPLSELEKLLKSLALDSEQQTIAYTKKDEIGALVSVYNSKVEQLKTMVQELAKAERQMAWKEMAKQVAHEIKNPLTPMKLNAQMLLHIEEKQGSIPPEKAKNLALTVIEQINILTRIANEFSRFAEIPKLQVSAYNATELLKQFVTLYENDTSFSYTIDLTGDVNIKIDKDHVLRALTNLVKNAQEAVWETNSPQIHLKAYLKNPAMLAISVSDNGSGISALVGDKIFEPNFTTKSSGMGLGLSMVKTSIEQMLGKIYFTPNTPKGTTFVLELPTC